jgi:glycosidase
MKVQESFNEKGLKKLSIGEKPKQDVSFTGHRVLKDDEGHLSYRFYLPNLKDDNTAVLETVVLIKDKNGNYNVYNDERTGKPIVKKINFIEGENAVDRYPIQLGIQDKPDAHAKKAIGYRFIINGKEDKPYLDSTLLTPDRKWNIATPPDRPVLEKARPMYHVMPDLMLTKENEKNVVDFRRTHFNKLGGNIDGIIQKLGYIKDLGARSILGTPLIGKDEISSHGYWTTNGVQVSGHLGDTSKFKELNKELFKKGMTWVNDGAFVNEGLEGIHLKHVLKWGTSSPYVNWLETFNFPQQAFALGVLPKKDEVNQHVGIKFINAPYKMVSEYDNDGNLVDEKLVSQNYDKNKPTYVQIYDKRLVSPDKKDDTGRLITGQANDDKIIRTYANKNPKDPNEINDYMDSVQPYCFEVKPEDVKQNCKNYQDAKKLNSNAKLIANFKEWSNFKLVPTDTAGGTNLWVGNRDIAKLRFMTAKEKMPDDDNKKKLIHIAENQVQDNIVQVGQFWTSEVAHTLYAQAAKQLVGAEKGNANSYLSKIKIAAKHGEIPETAPNKITQAHIQNLLDGNYNLKSAPAVNNVTEGIMKYPLDAIEFNSSTSSVLGSPFLKKLAANEDQIGKSRYELYTSQQENDYADIPDEFRSNYKRMDNLLAGKVTENATKILKSVDEIRKNAGDKPLLNGEELTEDGKQLYSLVATDVAKFVITQAVLKEAASKTDNKALFAGKNLAPDYNKSKDAIVYDPELLDKITPQSLELSQHDPKNEASTMINVIENGLKKGLGHEEQNDFAKHLAGRLAGLDAQKLQVARLIVDKTESGLEWRIDAAKDVCPMEDINQGNVAFEENWDKGAKFWKHFFGGVRTNNPNAYGILEVTNESEPVEATDPSKRVKYKIAQEANNKTLLTGGGTICSDYNFTYSTPHELFHSNTEKNERDAKGVYAITKKLIQGWGWPDKPYKTLGSLYSMTLDGKNQDHVFMSNHDKPRPLHLFALDAETFFGDKAKGQGKGKAMGDALTSSFSDAFKPSMPVEVTSSIINAVKNLESGTYHIKEDGVVVKKHYDSDHFAERDFKQNIKDVIKEAKLISPDAAKYFEAHPKEKKELGKDTLKAMVKPALAKMRGAMGFLVAMPGNPTIYNGDELGCEAGFETKSKNSHVQNRNPNHYEVIKEGHEDYIKEMADFHKEVTALMNLRHKPECSPLVNGTTEVISRDKSDTGSEKDNVAPLYRYNDEQDMIILLNNEGFDNKRSAAGKGNAVAISEPHIDLTQRKVPNFEAKNDDDYWADSERSLTSLIPHGTAYKNALNEKDTAIYRVVQSKDRTVLKKYENAKSTDPIKVEMVGTDLFLSRLPEDHEANVNKSTLSFKGNSVRKNLNVAIANKKFHIPQAPQNNLVQLNNFQGKTKACV